MRNEIRLFGGALAMIAAATAVLVVVPYFQLRDVKPPAGLHPYTSAQLRGRQEYIRQGCIYCHSQQPRDRAQAPDAERGWGRASVAADYFYDSPHLLGTMRTGPDLFNIGARQPSLDWHLGSIMPSFPYLFEVKPKAEPGDRVVTLPPSFAPAQGVVVARPAALDLVSYLVSLDHTYPLAPSDTGP
jgi:cytochrome c oxidase cbb3-type subunit 2